MGIQELLLVRVVIPAVVDVKIIILYSFPDPHGLPRKGVVVEDVIPDVDVIVNYVGRYGRKKASGVVVLGVPIVVVKDVLTLKRHSSVTIIKHRIYGTIKYYLPDMSQDGRPSFG